jgi:hypothetical protein
MLSELVMSTVRGEPWAVPIFDDCQSLLLLQLLMYVCAKFCAL